MICRIITTLNSRISIDFIMSPIYDLIEFCFILVLTSWIIRIDFFIQTSPCFIVKCNGPYNKRLAGCC